jgi:hypothetical protein
MPKSTFSRLAIMTGLLLVTMLAACSQPTPEPTATVTLTPSPV